MECTLFSGPILLFYDFVFILVIISAVGVRPSVSRLGSVPVPHMFNSSNRKKYSIEESQTVNPRGDLPLMCKDWGITHHQQCSEIPLQPQFTPLISARLDILKCMNTTDICYLSPSMKQASLLRLPVWLTSLQTFERNKCHDLSGLPPGGQILLTVLLYAAEQCIQLWLPSCLGFRVSCQTLLCCVWTAQVSPSPPQALLIFHQPTLGLDMSVAQWWLPSWQVKKRVCSSSIFDLHLLNNAEPSNVLQKGVLFTRQVAHTKR